MDAAEWLTQPFGGGNIDWASVPLRIVLGVVFIDAGLGKFRRGIDGFSGWLESLGYLMGRQLGPMVAATELVGGVLLLAGRLVSWVAIPLAVNMVVATYTNKVNENLPFQGSSDKQGYELDVVIVGAAVALIFLGAGPVSIDSLID
ncbi:MAG TPA: DoxX family protein [Dehalococcoidia bacterium]|nr:DoxX family protein [Dehalococcoidia bacterium]